MCWNARDYLITIVCQEINVLLFTIVVTEIYMAFVVL